MEDRRLSERVNAMEVKFEEHLYEHRKFEASLAENTELTKTIANNTSELVQLVKGAKGLRAFVVWVRPLLVPAAALWAWIKFH